MSNLKNITQYDEYVEGETIYDEYKEFTFNYVLLKITHADAEHYCNTNIFNFNEIVILNIKKCLKYYLPKYVCGFLNSNMCGNFYIGINDYGFIKGIPYSGDFPKNKISNYMKKIINAYVKNSYNEKIKLSKNIKINFIKLEKPSLPLTPLNKKYIKYLRQKNENNILYASYLQKIENWKIRFAFINQKLVDLVNNYESRIMLIDYIKKHDLNNIVIDILMSNYKLEYQDHEKVSIFKADPNNVHYWLTRWKDDIITQLKKDKPIFNNQFNYYTPLTLISGVGEMVPYWMNYNSNMNLYVIHIKINLPTISKLKEGIYSYNNSKKWISCRRMLLENGDPICNPI
jgi:hypothetical protein